MQFSCYHRHHQNTEGQMVFHVHPAMTGVWQCCMDDGSWTDYDDETSGMLDDAFTSGADSLSIRDVWAWRNHIFLLYWQEIRGEWRCHVIQNNEVILKVRSVRRILIIVDRGDELVAV